jgi:hypothetical protein
MSLDIVADALRPDALPSDALAERDKAVHRGIEDRVSLRRLGSKHGIDDDGQINEERAAAQLEAALGPRRPRRPSAPPGPTFFQKHKKGIGKIWRRDSREWWHNHYVEVQPRLWRTSGSGRGPPVVAGARGCGCGEYDHPCSKSTRRRRIVGFSATEAGLAPSSARR